MVERVTTTRIRWLAALGLGALATLLVFWMPGGLGAGRLSHAAALEYCRAEITRGFLVQDSATGRRAFVECMQRQGY